MRYHVRREDKEITDLTILKKILKSAKFVTIAICRHNEPYLVSLSYGYDEENNRIYFHCAPEGKKLDYLRENNKVWGQVLLDFGYSRGNYCDHLYASVHFSGKVTFVNDSNEKRRAIECMIRHLDSNPEALISKLSSQDLDKILIGRVDIEYMTGKKSKGVTI